MGKRCEQRRVIDLLTTAVMNIVKFQLSLKINICYIDWDLWMAEE